MKIQKAGLLAAALLAGPAGADILAPDTAASEVSVVNNISFNSRYVGISQIAPLLMEIKPNLQPTDSVWSGSNSLSFLSSTAAITVIQSVGIVRIPGNQLFENNTIAFMPSGNFLGAEGTLGEISSWLPADSAFDAAIFLDSAMIVDETVLHDWETVQGLVEEGHGGMYAFGEPLPLDFSPENDIFDVVVAFRWSENFLDSFEVTGLPAAGDYVLEELIVQITN